MLLAIDIGNTNMEFGVFEGDRLLANFRLLTDRNTTSDEVGLPLTQFFFLHGFDPKKIEAAVICSVVPQVMYSVNNAVRKYVGAPAFVVGENLTVPIENRYGQPKEVGADRLVNAYISFVTYGAPLIVVDFGTATTFDAVSADGAYLGGLIYPGVKTSLDALISNTAKLPRVELVMPKQVIGKSSIESMQSGILHGYVGAVKHIISEMEKEMGCSPTVVATGGLSGMIGRISGSFSHVDKTLTLKGLQKIYAADQ